MVEEPTDNATKALDKKANKKRKKLSSKKDADRSLKKQRKKEKRDSKDKSEKMTNNNSTSTEVATHDQKTETISEKKNAPTTIHIPFVGTHAETNGAAESAIQRVDTETQTPVANPSNATGIALELDLILQDKVFQKEQYQQKLCHLEFQEEHYQQKLWHLDTRKQQYRRKLSYIDIQKEQGQQQLCRLEKEIQQLVCRKENPSCAAANLPTMMTAKSFDTSGQKTAANSVIPNYNYGMEGLPTDSNDILADDDQNEYLSYRSDLSETTIHLTDSDENIQEENIIVV